MKLHNLYPFSEEKKSRKRVGRGVGSGRGGTSTKGHKGQNARSGGGVRIGFEGGQMPIQRRLPKYGFNNALFRDEYFVLNIKDLLAFFPDETKISLDDIYKRGIVKANSLVKLLSDGELSNAVTIEVHKCSRKAFEKVSAAGGTVVCLLDE